LEGDKGCMANVHYKQHAGSFAIIQQFFPDFPHAMGAIL
jgi:hypothetical protein